MLDTNIIRLLKANTNIVKLSNRLIDNVVTSTSTPNAPAISDLLATPNPIATDNTDLSFTKPANTVVKSYKSTVGPNSGFSVIADDISSPSNVTGLDTITSYWFKVTTRGTGNGVYSLTEVNSNIVEIAAN